MGDIARFKDYEDYFMNRTAEDIMEEYAEQRDEWQSLPMDRKPEERKILDNKE